MALVSDASQGEVWLVSLDPVQGSEIRKTRPCLIVSPDEMNHHLKTVIVAPMTTALRSYPTRVLLSFEDKQGQIALDQIRTIDRQRLIKRLGKVPVGILQQFQRRSLRCLPSVRSDHRACIGFEIDSSDWRSALTPNFSSVAAPNSIRKAPRR